MTIAHLIKDFDKRLVLLTIDMLQLDGHIVYLLQSLRTKEVWGIIVRFQQALVFRSDDRRQLCQISYQQQLHTTKGQVVVTEASQYSINSIEQVSTYHRYLVNNQQIDRRYDLTFLTTEVELTLHLGTRHIRREGQLEERMDGNAARINGSHTCWCHHDRAFARLLHHRPQERRLSRTSLTGQKDATSRILYKVPCGEQLVILFHGCKSTFF